MQLNNIICQTDSYKFSHYMQYPPKTETVFSYIESRGGKYPATVFFGLQAFIKEYLSKPITRENIDQAQALVDAHIGPNLFNREGWEYILKEHGGYLPLRIKAVAEGTVVPTHNILVSVENTDPECFWLTSFIETGLLRATWYPTTVATNSWSTKQLIKQFLEDTADDLSGLPWKLHDFGNRGVSSSESAGLGGMAHLVNFMGTDTVEALIYAQQYYNEPMAGFSVPAAEHSSITTWGKEGEKDAYKNMLEQFGGKFPIIAVVSDSYDIYKAVEKMWGEELKEMVVNSGSMLVVRPDSSIGHPSEVVSKVAVLLDNKFGSKVNSKGYKILNNVRIIQGDGITQESIERILNDLKNLGFSSDCVVFGQGGALLQQVNRDTQKFAYKASAAKINGRWVDVFKDPITDPGKRSKKGRLMLYRNRETGEIFTGIEALGDEQKYEPLLQTVFENGKVVKEWTFEEVRKNSNGLSS